MDNLKNFKLWIIFFLYTCGVSAFVQIILLPYILPNLHAGNGLLNSSLDSISFHAIAKELANKISKEGWTAWQLRPMGQPPAGIASIFYVLLLPDPRILIPVSAALHASAALILVNLLNLFLENKTRSTFCILPFLIFPSNIQWTAQWHKDSFSIVGVLLILQAMVSMSRLASHKAVTRVRANLGPIIFCLCGFFFIWLSRPYILTVIKPFAMTLFSLLFFILSIRLFKKELPQRNAALTLLATVFIICMFGQTKTSFDYVDFKESAPALNKTITTAPIEIHQEISIAPPSKTPTPAQPNTQALSFINEIPRAKEAMREEIAAKDYSIEKHWKKSPWLPVFLEKKAYSLAQMRNGFRIFDPTAKSNIDTDVEFRNAKDILFYLPRATQIVFLAFFPKQWLEEGSYPENTLMRRISAFEMLVTYFALLFLPYAIWYWRNRIEIWIISAFCTYIMCIYGLIVCNIGTLYRMRYAYVTTLVALGIAGCFVFFNKVRLKKKTL